MLLLLDNHPLLLQLLCALLGLIVGSFLNVVIHRLPHIITTGYHDASFNLWLPRSHCPTCKHTLLVLENIPVISYLILKGRCRYCHAPINRQYPFIECLSAGIAWFAAWYIGFSLDLLATLCFLWALLSLTVIDIKHQLLPDAITLPLLWLGLLFNTQSLFTSPGSAILGVIFGYLSLWSVYWLFKLLTKKEGMGYGDFKLLAALGAWCGWQALPMIILISSLLGSLVGLFLIIFYRRNRQIPLAFGPWLAIAGIIAFFWSKNIEQLWLNIMGVPFIIQ